MGTMRCMNTKTRTRARFLAPVVVLGLLATLGACSDDGDDKEGSTATLEGMSGTEVREAAKESMRDLTAVALTATLPQDEGAVINIDVKVDDEGDCDLKLATDPGEVQVVADADGTYIQGDRDYWTAITGSEVKADQTLEEIGDKWLPVDQEQFANWCDLEGLIESLTEGEEADIEVGDVIDHEGQQALQLRTSKDNGEANELLIAYEAPHYVLSSRGEGANEGSEMELSGFDEDVTVTIPSEDEQVDPRR